VYDGEKRERVVLGERVRLISCGEPKRGKEGKRETDSAVDQVEERRVIHSLYLLPCPLLEVLWSTGEGFGSERTAELVVESDLRGRREGRTGGAEGGEEGTGARLHPGSV
jgi:hypothetical protein